MLSPNLLTTRLREGVEAGIIEKDTEGAYGLTARGKSLADLLAPLDAWAGDWAAALSSRPGRSRRSNARTRR